MRIYLRGELIWSGRRDSNPRHPAWKAGTLPLSYSRENHSYFSPPAQLCLGESSCLEKNRVENQGGNEGQNQAPRDLKKLAEGYTLCAHAEGKSEKTIIGNVSAVMYLERYLSSQNLSTQVDRIGPSEIRSFILHLKQKVRFSEHPPTPPQQNRLSDHSVNTYLRAVRAFWSWLMDEGIITDNPFHHVKLPRVTKKVVTTFTAEQFKLLLSSINTSVPAGQRDYIMILMLLDTGLRISELIGLQMENVHLDEGVVKVLGKGGKERVVPVGSGVSKLIWRYIGTLRPEAENPKCHTVFLTFDGHPLTAQYVRNRMKKYGRKAGLSGVRCSPHTLRHTAAVSYLRNGGDAFTLQRLLGHTTLLMTRHYCEIADVDVKKAHVQASPVDNLMVDQRMGFPRGQKKEKK